MNRIINNPDLVVEDMLARLPQGARRPGRRHRQPPRRQAHVRAPWPARSASSPAAAPATSRPSSATSGDNMVDAVAIGEIFSSPTAKSFFDAFRAADGGEGVACLYGNYAGDNMNVKMAIEDGREGRHRRSRPWSPTTTCPRRRGPSASKRRGVAGEILMWKVGGAKAAMGGSLDEVIAAAQKAIDNTRCIGIGLSRLHHPGGRPAQLHDRGRQDGGRHRPPRRAGHRGRDDRAPPTRWPTLMLDVILPDLPFAAGDEVAVLRLRPGRDAGHGALHPLQPRGRGAGRRRGSRSAAPSSATTSPRWR